MTISGARLRITAAQEPAFAALSQSLQRAIPAARVTGAGMRAAPDPTAMQPLAWWDRARYMWRGRLRCCLLDTTLSVSPVHRLNTLPGDPCLDVSFKQLELALNPDAQATVSACSLAATIQVPHHEERSRPDAAPLRVPLAAIASMALTAALGLELPDGHPAGAHHVHPVVAVGQRVRLEGVQGPVDVAAALAVQAISISISVTIQSISLCGLVRPTAWYDVCCRHLSPASE